MIAEGKWPQYGLPREDGVYGIMGVTFHEIDDYNATAQDVFNYLNDESTENEAYHFVADENSVIEVMPLDYAVYHTGKMMDWGDEHTIAVAICKRLDTSSYMQALDNVMEVLIPFMETYSISFRDVYFHSDFNTKVQCPDTLMTLYDSSTDFAYNYVYPRLL